MKNLTVLIIAFVAIAGIAQAGQVTTHPVPDMGSTSALMGMALAGLTVVRRFIR